jgi:hypothetical protein
MHGWILDFEAHGEQPNNGIEELLHIFFEVTETTRAIGRAYPGRACTGKRTRHRRHGRAFAA